MHLFSFFTIAHVCPIQFVAGLYHSFFGLHPVCNKCYWKKYNLPYVRRFWRGKILTN